MKQKHHEKEESGNEGREELLTFTKKLKRKKKSN